MTLDLNQLAGDFDASKDPKRSPSSFAQYASGGRWQEARHLEFLSEQIKRTLHEPLRLLVTTPPRHGKTELISRYSPAWVLGHRPDWRVLLTSYEADFASGHGKAARGIFTRYTTKLFGVKADQSTTAGDNWNTSVGGGMSTSGVGGPLTGRGADLLLIDDPIKNAQEARSEVIREHHWEWFRSTAYTRLEPGGSCIIIMTRWHEDDLIGRILADPVLGPKWELVRLPAIVTESDYPDPLGREIGDPLWPERIKLTELNDRRVTVGPYIWNAMYQGRPAPEDGTVFKKDTFRYWQPVPKQDGWYDLGGGRMVSKDDGLRFVTADTAVTEKTSSDFTVIGKWLLTDRNELVLAGVYRRRLEGPDILPALRTVYREWSPSFIGIEKSAHALSIIQQARREGLPVTELPADKDKVARAIAAAAKFEANQLFLEAGLPLLEVIEHELLTFPNGSFDDCVDMIAYGAIEASRRGFDWDSAYGIVQCEACSERSLRDADKPCPYCGHINLVGGVRLAS